MLRLFSLAGSSRLLERSSRTAAVSPRPRLQIPPTLPISPKRNTLRSAPSAPPLRPSIRPTFTRHTRRDLSAVHPSSSRHKTGGSAASEHSSRGLNGTDKLDDGPNDDDGSSQNGGKMKEGRRVRRNKKGGSGEVMKDGRSVEETYVKLSQHEHVRLRPDSYVGSTKPLTEMTWVWEDDRIVYKEVTYVPALFRIFDEVIVNAADNSNRDPGQTFIEVSIDAKEGSVTVRNDGEGIPSLMHKKHNIRVPHLLFGVLLTGSNYDDSQEKITGGRNGYGAKLTNIFSKRFIVKTRKDGLLYRKEWRGGMTESDPDVVTKSEGPDFTEVSFWPDFEAMQMTGFDDDTLALFTRRVYDIAGVLQRSSALNLKLNGTTLPVKSFKDYVTLFEGTQGHELDDFTFATRNWKVCVLPSREEELRQMSFANAVWTRGGAHTNYIVDQVVASVVAVLRKQGSPIRRAIVVGFLQVFVSAQVVNPEFGSQGKEILTGYDKRSHKCVIPPAVLKRITKTVVELVREKLDRKAMSKPTPQNNSALFVPKLEDAHLAGTGRSQECTLILTEGDSAKALVMSGLSHTDRSKIGVFPLRGKLLNTRGLPFHKCMKSKEIQDLIQILGLSKKQDSPLQVGDLRYGRVVLMTDQDEDGSHIQGLVINMFDTFWPQLIKTSGFLHRFSTPIVRAFPKQGAPVLFYNMSDARDFMRKNGNGYKYKYYKGLGSSTPADAKEYFAKLSSHLEPFKKVDAADRESLEQIFCSDGATGRKEWLQEKASENVVKRGAPLSVQQFVNTDLKNFAIEGCRRGIPSVVDGLKPSQRKVLFACKQGSSGSMRVAQLGGIVSQLACYHHGESSLHDTIIRMAQDFPGSNNVPLLNADGQFGTRSMGGMDAASARYLRTNLNAMLVDNIFPDRDGPVLKYLHDEGQDVEPEFYVPVLPWLLVNGAKGIGVGWSTTVPSFDPFVLIQYVRGMLLGEKLPVLIPSVRGHTGFVKEVESGRYISYGKAMWDGPNLVISELPQGVWTENYLQTLRNLLAQKFVTSVRNSSTAEKLHVVVKMGRKSRCRRGSARVYDVLRLTSSIRLSNLVAFDPEGNIKAYSSPQDIIADWFEVRKRFYKRGRFELLMRLRLQVVKAMLKYKLARKLSRGKLSLSTLNEKALARKGFPVDPEHPRRGYTYLLGMTLSQLADVPTLRSALERKKKEFIAAREPVVKTWLRDLEKLENALRSQGYEPHTQSPDPISRAKAVRKAKAPVRKAKAPVRKAKAPVRKAKASEESQGDKNGKKKETPVTKTSYSVNNVKKSARKGRRTCEMIT
eukprot:Hpha_TRINITY_DN14062_c2_g1::TRINITY_DN14062_c2_g1_i1::g.43869::m.43869/K03164/TOP2; DNA topoisomerase II